MEYKCLETMSKSQAKSIMDYLKWKVFHRDEIIDAIQIERLCRCDAVTAQKIISELCEKEWIKMVLQISCPYCGENTLIFDTSYMANLHRNTVTCSNEECHQKIDDISLYITNFFYKVNKAKIISNKYDNGGVPKMIIEKMGKKRAAKLFISYAHEDEKYKIELEKHLAVLKRKGMIETWNDRELLAGSELNQEIDNNLLSADIILLLVSADFIASDYCYSNEMEKAIELHNEGRTRVIPIIVRACDWTETPLFKLTALPQDGKAIANWGNLDNAYLNIVEGLKRVL